MQVIPVDNTEFSTALALTLSVMLCPNEEEVRSDLASALTWNAKLAQDGEIAEFALTRRELAAILRAPKLTDAFRTLEKASVAGQIAGELLVLALQIDDHDGGASLRKARFLVRYRNFVFNEGRKKKLVASDSSIKNAWNSYRSVAHLWGAFRLLALEGSGGRFRDDEPAPIDEVFEMILDISIPRVAATAIGLLSRASALTPRHQTGGGRPILSLDASWTFPETFVRNKPEIALPPLPDWAVSVNRDYGSRQDLFDA